VGDGGGGRLVDHIAVAEALDRIGRVDGMRRVVRDRMGELMRRELERIKAAPGLSKNVLELASRALD
jgi:hypothetical protein